MCQQQDLHTQLKRSWDELLLPIHGSAERAGSPFADLVSRYSGPERYYHNLTHLGEVLGTVDKLAAQASDSIAVRLAAWFHDAVYDSKAKDNEEQSADLATRALSQLKLAPELIESVGRLILLTRSHRAEADDRDGQILLDADLSILGADAMRYDAYAAAIRQEYAWVAEADYRAGRQRVLESFLHRPRIYFTQVIRESREESARQNMRRELEGLLGSTTQ